MVLCRVPNPWASLVPVNHCAEADTESGDENDYPRGTELHRSATERSRVPCFRRATRPAWNQLLESDCGRMHGKRGESGQGKHLHKAQDVNPGRAGGERDKIR